MSDTAKKQVRKLKIIEDDPNLSAFESDLNEQASKFIMRRLFEILTDDRLVSYPDCINKRSVLKSTLQSTPENALQIAL